MPRDANGNYTLPAGNPVITKTTIDTSWANPTMEDIAAELTGSLSRSGEGGMLVPFKNIDGSVGQPGITWTLQTSLGFYRHESNDMRVGVAGVDVARWIGGSYQLWDGTAWLDDTIITGRADAGNIGKADSGLFSGDADDLLINGFNGVSSSTVNIPVAGSGTIHVVARNSNNVTQTYTRYSTGVTYVRTKNGGIWGAWIQLSSSTDLGAYLPLAGGTVSGVLEVTGALRQGANLELLGEKLVSKTQNLILGSDVTGKTIIIRPAGSSSTIAQTQFLESGRIRTSGGDPTDGNDLTRKAYVDAQEPKAGEELNVVSTSNRQVTFATPYSDANYAVALSVDIAIPIDMPTIRNRTANGFQIDNNDVGGAVINITWMTTPYNN